MGSFFPFYFGCLEKGYVTPPSTWIQDHNLGICMSNQHQTSRFISPQRPSLLMIWLNQLNPTFYRFNHFLMNKSSGLIIFVPVLDALVILLCGFWCWRVWLHVFLRSKPPAIQTWHGVKTLKLAVNQRSHLSVWDVFGFWAIQNMSRTLQESRPEQARFSLK